LSSEDGDILDKSAEDTPLIYLHGASNIISGLEKELAGKNIGDSFEIKGPAEHGYGKHQETLVQVLPRSSFQEVESITPPARSFRLKLIMAQ